jgi:2-hydroxy-3-oxopropionate reductase
MPERIGFIGLGIMGKPMVRNLLKAGFAVTVTNRSQPAIDELAAEGATAATSPRAVAEQSDIVITMVPDGPDVEAVLLGDDGTLQGAHPGLLVIDMSTISPVTAKHLAAQARERGVRMLDAPVSGGDKGAIAGTLSIMVGGDQADFERAQPIFEALGKTITHCGPHGAGQTVKACNQAVVALVLEAVSEALVLGSKAGVDPAIILQVLGGGMAQTRAMELRGPTMIEHRFEPGFKVKLHRKDLGIVLDTAREYGVALPLTSLVDQMFTTLVEQGHGELDHSSLLTIIESLSHHTLEQRTKN